MWRKSVQRCIVLFRNTVTTGSLLTFCRLLCLANIGWFVPVCSGQCPPSEDIRSVSLNCFRDYSTQKLNLDKSATRLFSGIDVEILRAYCSSYLNGMECIRRLVRDCPQNETASIDRALTTSNVRGLQKELNDLCRTNRLYEIYAQDMTCFRERGHKSDWCFENKLNITSQSLYQLPNDQLCSRMREVTDCIENNIRHGCGLQAAELVHKLVKAMVRGSGSCSYNIHIGGDMTPGHTTSQNGPKKTSDPSKRNTSSKPTNAASSGHLNIVLLLVSSICTVILSHHRTCSAS